MPILPRDVRKAFELLESEPSRERSIDELAAACGVARRTLEEHFRHFVGRTASQVRARIAPGPSPSRVAAGTAQRYRHRDCRALRLQSPWPLFGCLQGTVR